MREAFFLKKPSDAMLWPKQLIYTGFYSLNTKSEFLITFNILQILNCGSIFS